MVKSRNRKPKQNDIEVYPETIKGLLRSADYHRKRVERNKEGGRVYDQAIKASYMYFYIAEHRLLDEDATKICEKLKIDIVDESPYQTLINFVKEDHNIESSD